MLNTSLQPTNPAIVAALIGALVAVIVGVVNLIAAYRLKLKEFRVTQIKSRIDTLEQAGVSMGPESKENEPDKLKENVGEGDDPALTALEASKRGAWFRLDEIEKQYTKYKWLLDPKSHQSIEELLMQCNTLLRQLAKASVERDIKAFTKSFPTFVEQTQQLQRTYEAARLSKIESLYLILNNEVGI
jgi:hypothetical protein